MGHIFLLKNLYNQNTNLEAPEGHALSDKYLEGMTHRCKNRDINEKQCVHSLGDTLN